MNPTIILQTDEGTFVASASFSGEHVLGIKRIEKPRKAGESRRRRRTMSGSQHTEHRRPAQESAPAGSHARIDEPAPLDIGFTWVDSAEVADAPATEALETEDGLAAQESDVDDRNQDSRVTSDTGEVGDPGDHAVEPPPEAPRAGHRRLSRAERRAQRKKRSSAA